MLAPAPQPPDDQRNHYELLGLPPFETDIRKIQRQVREVLRELRKYQTGPRAAQACRQIDQVAAATACLTDPVQKWNYDDRLRKEFGLPPVAISATYSPPTSRPVPTRLSGSSGEKKAALLLLVGGLTVLATLIVWAIR